MKSESAMRALRSAAPEAASPRDHSAVFAQIVAEPGDARLANATPARALKGTGRRARPRILAGSSLGLAGVSAGLVLALSGSAAAPAFAISRQSDGSVLVTVNTAETNQPWVEAADKKLASMGIHEQINVQVAPGPATKSGWVSCSSVTGPGVSPATGAGYVHATGTPAGPPIEVQLGQTGTDTVPAGNSGSSGPGGTVHLASCVYYPDGPGTQVGNSGPGN